MFEAVMAFRVKTLADSSICCRYIVASCSAVMNRVHLWLSMWNMNVNMGLHVQRPELWSGSGFSAAPILNSSRSGLSGGNIIHTWIFCYIYSLSNIWSEFSELDIQMNHNNLHTHAVVHSNLFVRLSWIQTMSYLRKKTGIIYIIFFGLIASKISSSVSNSLMKAIQSEPYLLPFEKAELNYVKKTPSSIAIQYRSRKQEYSLRFSMSIFSMTFDDLWEIQNFPPKTPQFKTIV